MRPLVMRLALLCLIPATALAQAVPARSFFSLPSSNGHGAVMVDARTAKVVHFREHLPATEEPQLDAQGREVWVGNQPQMVPSRDLLFDAYFGLRAGGTQQWLSQAPSSSGYDTASPSPRGGSGLVTFTQAALGLDTTTYVFAPRGLEHAGFVMALHVENKGSAAVSGVSAFSLHNLHLGFGRPGVMQKLQANGETVAVSPNRDVAERGFAGVVVARPLGPVSRAAAWNGSSTSAQNAYAVVSAGGTADLVDRSGDLGVADDWATAFQFDVGTLQPGADAWVAVVVAHHGDPFAAATVQAWLDAFVGTMSARDVVFAERAAWSTFQQALVLPAGVSPDEEAALRQSAVVLDMAQVREGEAYLRAVLTNDGDLRRSRFSLVDGGTTLPGTVRHRGRGAVLASLPPGEWTYAWSRDGAYSAAAMATLGMTDASRAGLRFFLDAEGGRFKDWTELAGYSMPPYVVSLTRYVGFGVEETDFNAFGPNLELDGFGLFLWALRQHELRTGDTSLADARWNDIATKVAEPLVALIDPATGLMRKDSSIWETHWNGRERAWTYTNVTAARGLCDAAAIAERRGDTARASSFRQAGLALRRAIAEKLTDASGALASNREELSAGEGYFDAAVLDALAMGLFHPAGRIATATLAAMDARLRVSAGPGWARNDDRVDHGGAADLSPWGSEYDSAEWVVTDLRGEVALRAAGNVTRASAVLDWVTAHATQNAGLVPETFDEATGAWKFNAPMVGFGAGVYALALAHRGGVAVEPACGAYDDAPVLDGGVDAGGNDAGLDAGVPDAGRSDAGLSDAGTHDAGAVDAGTGPGGGGSGCGCTAVDGPALWALALVALARRGRPAR
jgi:uncharacterized protein (TIGR03382 family)